MQIPVWLLLTRALIAEGLPVGLTFAAIAACRFSCGKNSESLREAAVVVAARRESDELRQVSKDAKLNPTKYDGSRHIAAPVRG